MPDVSATYVQLDADLRARMKEFARKEKRTHKSVIELALEDFLSKHGMPQGYKTASHKYLEEMFNGHK